MQAMEEYTTKPKNSIAMHHDSQSISKLKPKVRIVHVFAPEIIKTDVQKFRELVQRLTGRSSRNVGCKKRRQTGRTVAEVIARYNRSEEVERQSEEDIDSLFQSLGDLPLLPAGRSSNWLL